MLLLLSLLCGLLRTCGCCCMGGGAAAPAHSTIVAARPLHAGSMSSVINTMHQLLHLHLQDALWLQFAACAHVLMFMRILASDCRDSSTALWLLGMALGPTLGARAPPAWDQCAGGVAGSSIPPCLLLQP